jgi:hypothetical protein
VQVIVLPVARLSAALGSGALGPLVGAVEMAHTGLALVRAPTDTVDQLRVVVASWESNIDTLLITPDAYANADITAAERYLKALKKQLSHTESALMLVVWLLAKSHETGMA